MMELVLTYEVLPSDISQSAITVTKVSEIQARSHWGNKQFSKCVMIRFNKVAVLFFQQTNKERMEVQQCCRQQP